MRKNNDYVACFTKKEFSIAMWLIQKRLDGLELPDFLPNELQNEIFIMDDDSDNDSDSDSNYNDDNDDNDDDEFEDAASIDELEKISDKYKLQNNDYNNDHENDESFESIHPDSPINPNYKFKIIDGNKKIFNEEPPVITAISDDDNEITPTNSNSLPIVNEEVPFTTFGLKDASKRSNSLPFAGIASKYSSSAPSQPRIQQPHPLGTSFVGQLPYLNQYNALSYIDVGTNEDLHNNETLSIDYNQHQRDSSLDLIKNQTQSEIMNLKNLKNLKDQSTIINNEIIKKNLNQIQLQKQKQLQLNDLISENLKLNNELKKSKSLYDEKNKLYLKIKEDIIFKNFKISKLNDEKLNLKNQLNDLNDEINNLNNEIKKIIDEKNNDDEILKLNDDLKLIENDLKISNIEKESLKLKESSLIKLKQENLEKLKQEKSLKEQILKNSKDENVKLSNNINSLNEEISSIDEQLQSQQNEKDKDNSKISESIADHEYNYNDESKGKSSPSGNESPTITSPDDTKKSILEPDRGLSPVSSLVARLSELWMGSSGANSRASPRSSISRKPNSTPKSVSKINLSSNNNIENNKYNISLPKPDSTSTPDIQERRMIFTTAAERRAASSLLNKSAKEHTTEPKDTSKNKNSTDTLTSNDSSNVIDPYNTNYKKEIVITNKSPLDNEHSNASTTSINSNSNSNSKRQLKRSRSRLAFSSNDSHKPFIDFKFVDNINNSITGDDDAKENKDDEKAAAATRSQIQFTAVKEILKQQQYYDMNRRYEKSKIPGRYDSTANDPLPKKMKPLAQNNSNNNNINNNNYNTQLLRQHAKSLSKHRKMPSTATTSNNTTQFTNISALFGNYSAGNSKRSNGNIKGNVPNTDTASDITDDDDLYQDAGGKSKLKRSDDNNSINPRTNKISLNKPFKSEESNFSHLQNENDKKDGGDKSKPKQFQMVKLLGSALKVDHDQNDGFKLTDLSNEIEDSEGWENLSRSPWNSNPVSIGGVPKPSTKNVLSDLQLSSSPKGSTTSPKSSLIPAPVLVVPSSSARSRTRSRAQMNSTSGNDNGNGNGNINGFPKMAPSTTYTTGPRRFKFSLDSENSINDNNEEPKTPLPVKSSRQNSYMASTATRPVTRQTTNYKPSPRTAPDTPLANANPRQDTSSYSFTIMRSNNAQYHDQQQTSRPSTFRPNNLNTGPSVTSYSNYSKPTPRTSFTYRDNTITPQEIKTSPNQFQRDGINPNSNHSEPLQQLIGMGFSKADSLRALEHANWDLQTATNYLLDTC